MSQHRTSRQSGRHPLPQVVPSEIQRLIDERKGDTVTVPAGEYSGDVVVPPGVRLVCESGVRLSGCVTVHGSAAFDRWLLLYPNFTRKRL
jgi:hypothetical protein